MQQPGLGHALGSTGRGLRVSGAWHFVAVEGQTVCA